MPRMSVTNIYLFTTTLLVSGAFSILNTPANADTTENWLTQFDTKLQAAYEDGNIPGMAVAVVKGNKTLLAKGYGLRDVENDLPVNADTLFHIASTHKSMNAMLIATLVDDGIVNWDTPAAEYYPEFQLKPSDSSKNITLRHLLSMSSGIPDNAEEALGEDATVQDVFKAAQQTQPLGKPGTHFSYSNISASIAGYIAVIAETGNDENLLEDYGTLLQSRILQPIGMSRSTTQISLARRDGNLAKAYSVSFFGTPSPITSIDTDSDILAPAGSLKSSAREMALYLSTQLKQGIAPNQNKVVSAANLRQTWVPAINNYALGWVKTEYKGMDLSLHTGSFDGFVSVIVMLPEKDIAFVLLANSEAAGNLTEEAHELLIDAIQED